MITQVSAPSFLTFPRAFTYLCKFVELELLLRNLVNLAVSTTAGAAMLHSYIYLPEIEHQQRELILKGKSFILKTEMVMSDELRQDFLFVSPHKNIKDSP